MAKLKKSGRSAKFVVRLTPEERTLLEGMIRCGKGAVNKGEVMAVKITAGNTDDREPFDTMTAALEGKIVGDKGYISKHLFQEGNYSFMDTPVSSGFR